MNLTEKITRCLERAVENNEAAGISVLCLRGEREACYAQAGMADIERGEALRRDHIFRLYSQSKPITAAAVTLLIERGLIDVMDPVEEYLPGFRNQKVLEGRELRPVRRPACLMDLLGMTAGLSYPDIDGAGMAAAELFREAHARIEAGNGYTTVELANLIGQLPLAFHPGEHYRYSTCADVLGAVVEVVSGKPFSQFLRDEIFEPLGMKDTGFCVTDQNRRRLVSAYRRTEDGLVPHSGINLAVGFYDREPAYAAGGAGLVSTLDDYAAFAGMLRSGGTWRGVRVLSPAGVRFLTQSQLTDAQTAEMWHGLEGYSYGKMMRAAVHTGQINGLSCPGEYGWDGWLGTYFANFPEEDITLLLMQNVTDAGTTPVARRVRNIVLAELA